MNAINHAATALLINKRWPGTPIVPTLVAVQLVEVLWVVCNLLGIESTTTAPHVLALDDIHLVDMPYSHSVGATLVLASSVWLAFSKLLKKPAWGVALAAAVSSHIALDLVTHVQDIALAPGIETPKLGLGLYGIPLLALVVETLYGVWCWWVFEGSKALLVAIVALNVAALPFYSPSVRGPEQFLSGQPEFFAAFIGLHIAIGLVAVGILARAHWRRPADVAQAGAAAVGERGG